MRDHPGTERREVDVGDGLLLHVALSGAGPPLVLLHGFTGSTETWAPLRVPLGAAHSVIAVDLPGHGRSTAPADSRRYALNRFADDLARVLDAVTIECVALLGYSMGGRAALRFALSHGDRVAALVLESTSPGISDPVRRNERLASDNALADAIERDGIQAFVERWEKLPLWESQRAMSDATRARLRAQRLANQPRGLANSLRGAGAGADLPVLDLLRAIRAPTLLVAGALDAPYVESARLLETSIPDVQMIVVPEAGHAVHLERPSEAVAATIGFLRDVPSVAGRWC
ncbi:MAG: 2-succinyl-6-hydroxy-2,4-cyclohexadiene-1-carboxylate synthase [Acidobacteriota bacterium]|nr:2-succinyl-6-hydroxy-2,4-cyclohexadiene-1-carboxylate synthase [Acidobacteriota bacterium]